MNRDAREAGRQNEASARPGAAPRALPDICNMGVWLRVLLAVNGAALLLAFDAADGARGMAHDFLGRAALLEPVVLGSLSALCILKRLLVRLPRGWARSAAVGVAVALTLFFGVLLAPLGIADRLPLKPMLWAAVGAVALLLWFDLRARAQSPAVTEARLMALTARIRPHFLFNSLNAVLGTIRGDPKRAERALEELADLFRALMRENRELAPLSDEIALARQYLELERLRLGDRLDVRWEIDSCPPDALVPPLLLQPLLENAVYHGIEPAPEPGEIVVRIARTRDRVRIDIVNPLHESASHSTGNHMALANIRERLMLFYDLEAELSVQAGEGTYAVHISIPYRSEVDK